MAVAQFDQEIALWAMKRMACAMGFPMDGIESCFRP
jgi:hypothetical protein